MGQREYIYEHPPRRSAKYDLYTSADGIQGGSGEDVDLIIDAVIRN